MSHIHRDMLIAGEWRLFHLHKPGCAAYVDVFATAAGLNNADVPPLVSPHVAYELCVVEAKNGVSA
jgi:hypothetical protein